MQFALEAINAGTGGAIDNEWHTQSYETKVKETLQGNQAEYAETESDIISALLQEVRTKMNQVIGGATPTPVSTVSQMTDPSKLYLLTTDGEWYYHNGTTFVSGGVYGAGVTDAIPTQGSTNAVQSGGVYSALADVREDVDENSFILDHVTDDYGTEEETVTVNIPLNLDIREGKRTAEAGGMSLSDSTVTNAYIRAFLCEANKAYTLTITNGETPALIAQRATVVVTTPETFNATVLWVQHSTNTSNPTDTVVFTPESSGYVYFNLDMNVQSIAVTTTETRVITEKTANDKQARADISALQSTTATLSENVGQLSGDVDSLGETVDAVESNVDSITETYHDGTVETEITLDLSYIRTNKRADGVLNQSVSLDNEHNLGFNNSSVTTCVARCFECEADKTYTVTITNGTTPASVTERDTVVVVVPKEGKYYGIVNYTKRTTNSRASTDVVTFTSPVAGYVFLNLDANYQSVSVAELQDRIVTTAVDAKARNTVESVSKYILNGNVQKEVAFESGTFDASLADVSGSGYRSNVISGVSGCAVCIKVNPSYSFVYGDGANSLITIYGIYVIHPKNDTIRIGLTDTPENVGFEMRIYKERGHQGKYDVIVAASDSTAEDKARSDIICDGVNDELDLQFAVNWNFGRERRTRYNDMCNVLLMPGTYNIDSFTQQYTAYGQLTRERYGVMVGNDTPDHRAYVYRATIEGCYEAEHSRSNCATLINVTNAGVATLGANVLNAVFGIALLAEGDTGSIRMNALSMTVRNLGIYTNGVTNKVIGIDAYQAGNAVIENCDIWATGTAYLSPTTIATQVEGSIGIRAGRGSCLGVRQIIKGNRINGFYDGISLCGEHFLCQDNLQLACTYGFATNQYEVGGAVQHPNIFIGNSVEQCLHMGRLGESGMRDTIIYIGGSVENMLTAGETRVAMLPIEISSTTANRGRIESDSLASPYMESMFYEGYGQTFEQTIYPYYQA